MGQGWTYNFSIEKGCFLNFGTISIYHECALFDRFEEEKSIRKGLQK
jgi:hypothetical protein